MARPLYTGLVPELKCGLSTFKVAAVRSLPSHSEIVPSSVEKMNAAPSKLEAFELNTMPVGVAAEVSPVGEGILTTIGSRFPAGPYSVETPELLSEIQIRLGDPKAMPHGLISFLSWMGAACLKPSRRNSW